MLGLWCVGVGVAEQENEDENMVSNVAVQPVQLSSSLFISFGIFVCGI